MSRLVGFASSMEQHVELAFKRDTIGLQTKEQFAEKARQSRCGALAGLDGSGRALTRRLGSRRCAAQRANKEREWERERLRTAGVAEAAEAVALQRKRAAQKAAATARLSFADDEAAEEEEDEERGDAEREARADAPPTDAPADAPGGEGGAKRPRFGAVVKNPGVATAFLPDRAREREDALERARLKETWLAEQAALKAQPLQVIYSYWDGAGHRKAITVKQGDTIGTFLRGVRDALGPEFRELKAASPDQMLYVKEDLIIPNSLTFHELIVSKARGKSGPLFHFDVHDDVRAVGDARVEKDEAHAGKVLERHWYDKNKHIFPASRWEIYDPSKDYGACSEACSSPAGAATDARGCRLVHDPRLRGELRGHACARGDRRTTDALAV